MNRLARTLSMVGKILSRQGCPWALVGGLAVSARTEPRFTRDVDVAVAVASDAEAEAVVQTFRGADFRIIALVEQEATGRLATVRMAPADAAPDGVVVDLMFASSGIESEVVRAAEPVEVFSGVRVPLPRTGHLIALKVLSRDTHRPQDQVDLQALVTAADDEELGIAREALSLITRRGFNRQRNLLEDLDALD